MMDSLDKRKKILMLLILMLLVDDFCEGRSRRRRQEERRKPVRRKSRWRVREIFTRRQELGEYNRLFKELKLSDREYFFR